MDFQDDFSFVRQYLGSSEYILWKGAPERGNLMTKRECKNLFFGFLAFVFLVFWFLGAKRFASDKIFPLFAIPAALICLYNMFGSIVTKAITLKKTRYVITNRKIIRARGKKIDFLNGPKLPPSQVETYRNGCGSLYFHSFDSENSNHGSFGPQSVFSILNVGDVMAVQAAIQRMDP